MPATSAHCPFCGSHKNRVEDFGGETHPRVICDNCGAEGPPGDTWAEAIERWDTRSEPRHDGGDE